MKMNQINSVCVYSASSTKIDAVYFQAADTLGYLLAEHRIRLINGAGSIGLMRSVADAVLKNGENAYVSEYFIVKGLDQYEEDYNLNGVPLTWNSDNEKAFRFDRNNIIMYDLYYYSSCL